MKVTQDCLAHLKFLDGQWKKNCAEHKTKYEAFEASRVKKAGSTGGRGAAVNPIARLYDPIYGLGSSYRLSIACALLEKSAFDVHEETSLGEDVCQRALRIGEGSVATNKINTIADWACRHLTRLKVVKLQRGAFLNHQLGSAGQVFEFVRWLGFSVDILEHATSLLNDGAPAPEWFSSEARLRLEKRVGRFLIEAKNPAPELVLNLHQAGMAEGMRALAGRLCADLMDDEPLAAVRASRPVCYLPGSLLRGASFRRVKLPQLVGWLHAFFDGRKLEDAAPIEEPTEMWRAIAAIRQRMSETPAIIIIGECAALDAALPHLSAAMLDEPVQQLLPHLLYPLEQGPSVHTDPDAFARNRFVVLSDAPLDPVGPFFAKPDVVPYPQTEDLCRIVAKYDYRHRERITALVRQRQDFRSENHLRLLEAVFDADAGEALASAPGGAEAMMSAYLAELEQTRPADALVLRFVALAPEGVRVTTLFILLTLWTFCVGDKSAWRKGASMSDLREALERLRSFVMLLEDEHRAGIDDEAMSRSFMFPLAPGVLGDSRDLADFRTRGLREWVNRNTYGTRLPVTVARMQRVLFEETVRQQTVSMRHGTSEAGRDARALRPLFQAIYHGLCSLQAGPLLQDACLRDLPRVLPMNPIRAYDRVYSVFYRQIGEHPPAWELARVFGKEGLKKDLMLAACNAGSKEVFAVPLLGRHSEGLPPTLSPFLAKLGNGVSRPNAARIAVDQMIGIARSALHRSEVGAAKQAVTIATTVLNEEYGETAVWSQNELSARLVLSKLQIDLELLGDKNAAELVASTMTAVATPEGTISELEKLRERILACEDGEARIGEMLNRGVRDLAKPKDIATPHRVIRAWSDVLTRYAENLATDTERELSEADGFPNFLLAYLAFRLSDQYRREVFERDPLGRSHHAGSHPTRTFVRVALKLAKALDPARATRPGVAHFEGQAAGPDIFRWEARRQVDLLARYFHRTPTERPSLLITESLFDRLVSLDLEAAERSLAQADAHMAGAIERPRVRMRLLLERCKVFRQRARLAPGLAARYRDAGERDAGLLVTLANHYGHAFWRRLAETQITASRHV